MPPLLYTPHAAAQLQPIHALRLRLRRPARLASSSCGCREYSRCTRQRSSDVRCQTTSLLNAPRYIKNTGLWLFSGLYCIFSSGTRLGRTRGWIFTVYGSLLYFSLPYGEDVLSPIALRPLMGLVDTSGPARLGWAWLMDVQTCRNCFNHFSTRRVFDARSTSVKSH